MYSRWLVTDLVSTATLFLFGQAHKELYKESEGSVLILYNAKCSKDGGNSGYSRSIGTSLTLDKAEQVQRIGASPDLGKCAGVKKVRVAPWRYCRGLRPGPAFPCLISGPLSEPLDMNMSDPLNADLTIVSFASL